MVSTDNWGYEVCADCGARTHPDFLYGGVCASCLEREAAKDAQEDQDDY